MTSRQQAWAALRPRLKILDPLPFSPDHWSLVERMHANFNDGNSYDVTMILRPCVDTWCFPEIPDVLAVAAGGSSQDPVIDYSNASIHVIPEHLLIQEPRSVIDQLLDGPAND